MYLSSRLGWRHGESCEDRANVNAIRKGIYRSQVRDFLLQSLFRVNLRSVKLT